MFDKPEVLNATTSRETSLFVSTLALATGAGLFPLFSYGVLGPFIADEWSLDSTSFGGAVTALFLAGAFWSPIASRIIAYLSHRQSFMVLFLSAGISWSLMALSEVHIWFTLSMICAAFPLAMTVPLTARTVEARMPTGRQGLSVGLAQSGAQLASFLTGALLPLGAVVVGWRVTLAIAAGTWLFTGVVLTVRSIPAPSVTHAHNARRLLLTESPDDAMARPPHFIAFVMYAFFMNGANVAAVSYIPLYANSELHLNATLGGLAMSLLAGATIVSKVGWARVVEQARSPWRPAIFVALFGAISAALLMYASETRSWAFWVGVGQLGLTSMGWVPLMMVLLGRSSPTVATDRAAATLMGVGFLGAGVIPAAFGMLVDRAGQYRAGWFGLGLLFSLSALMPLAWRFTSAAKSVNPRT